MLAPHTANPTEIVVPSVRKNPEVLPWVVLMLRRLQQSVSQLTSPLYQPGEKLIFCKFG